MDNVKMRINYIRDVRNEFKIVYKNYMNVVYDIIMKKHLDSYKNLKGEIH